MSQFIYPAVGERSLRDAIDVLGEKDVVFLTGATGSMGVEAVVQLLTGSRCHIVAPARANNDEAARARLLDCLAYAMPVELTSEQVDRVHVIAADVSMFGFGLDGSAYSRLCQWPTYVLNLAADNRVRHDGKVPMAINEAIARSMVAFCSAIPPGQLTKAVNIGTAYEVGEGSLQSTPTVYEVRRPGEWWTGYTESKARAAERWMGWDGPWLQLRPSNVGGNQTNGWAPGFSGYGPFVEALGAGALPVLPADPEGVFDIVPRDTVVSWFLALMVAPGVDRRVIQCTTGDAACTVKELVTLVAERLLRVPIPRFVWPDASVDEIAAAGAGDLAEGIEQAVRPYRTFLGENGRFANDVLQLNLNAWGLSLELGSLGTYVRRLVTAGQAARWGSQSRDRRNPGSQREWIAHLAGGPS